MTISIRPPGAVGEVRNLLSVGVAGGGPAGLFAARLLRLHGVADRVDVYERNSADATFGFGIVFSDRTMSAFRDADPATYRQIAGACKSWAGMEIRYGGRTLRHGGYGFSAISRKTLLKILQEQAAGVGVRIIFGTEADAVGLQRQHDLVVAADGVNSAAREALSDRLGTTSEDGTAKFAWFGTSASFEMVTFPFVRTEFGAFGAHAYPYADGLSTFVIETSEKTWRAAGMDDPRHGDADTYSAALMGQVFAEHLRGQPLLVNNSRWMNFRVIRNRAWSCGNLVLLGDAAHTAHFSVGSGTKMAMEDAIALAAALRRRPAGGALPAALARYEADRRPDIARTQRSAMASMRWWETFGQRMDRDPDRFGFHFLTRTSAISLAGLRRRHPERVEAAEAAYLRAAGPAARGDPAATGALTAPLRLRTLVLPSRLVTVVADENLPQPSACEAAARAGSGLVLADWRQPGAAARPWPGSGHREQLERWRATAATIRAHEAVLGALIDARDGAAAGLAAAARLPLVEVLLGHDLAVFVPQQRWAGALGAPRLRDIAGRCVLVAGLGCPAAGAYTAGGDTLVRLSHAAASAGAAALHLWPHTRWGAEGIWSHTLEHADRLRTETGLPVFAGWAPEMTSGSGDDSRTRLHAALVAGRIDAVVGWRAPADQPGPDPATESRGVPAGRPESAMTAAVDAAAARSI